MTMPPNPSAITTVLYIRLQRLDICPTVSSTAGPVQMTFLTLDLDFGSGGVGVLAAVGVGDRTKDASRVASFWPVLPVGRG